MSTKRFFTPFVGSNYKKGINGKKVLVIGASFYCNNAECKFFTLCTSVECKDSSAYDAICPIYTKDNKKLHLEPEYCIEDRVLTYQKFAKSMAKYIGSDDYDEIWSYMAFTNYVQFFLPAPKGYRETRKSDLSERDYDAFVETLAELKPDIVIVWGCVINNRIKQDNPDMKSNGMLERTNWYVCQIVPKGHSSPVTIINPYHPSSMSAWYTGLDDFDTYFGQLIKNK